MLTKTEEFVNILYIRVQRLLGHADLQMATRYVQDVSEQTDRVIENSRIYVVRLVSSTTRKLLWLSRRIQKPCNEAMANKHAKSRS
jgi:hypothetical protein